MVNRENEKLPFLLEYYWVWLIIIVVLFGLFIKYDVVQDDRFTNYAEDVNDILKEYQQDIAQINNDLRDLELGVNKNLEDELIDFDSIYCYLKIEEQNNKYYSNEFEGNKRQCPPDEKYYNERYNSTIEVNIR